VGEPPNVPVRPWDAIWKASDGRTIFSLPALILFLGALLPGLADCRTAPSSSMHLVPSLRGSPVARVRW